MQQDMFEARERVYLKSLQEERDRLKEELSQVNQQIHGVLDKSRCYHLGGKLWVSGHTTKGIIAFSQKTNGELEFFSPLSLDLLTKAVENLTHQETHANEPERIHRSNGSESFNPPW